MNWTAILMAVAVGAALVLVPVCRRAGAERKNARTTMVKQMLKENAFVLDVRTPGEFSGGHYPGALNIPVQELQSRMSEVPKGRPIVAYCASGARSETARRMLEGAGYENVVNAGGLSSMPRP